MALEQLEDRCLLSCPAPGVSTALSSPVASDGSASLVTSLPTFQAPQLLCDTTGAQIQVSQYSVLALADWNADGLPDLLVGEKTADGRGQVLFYRNVGSRQKPAFEPGEEMGTGSEPLATFTTTAANGEACGELSRVVPVPISSSVPISVPAEGCLGVFPRVADLNGDGKPDVLLGLATGGVQVCWNLKKKGSERMALELL